MADEPQSIDDAAIKEVARMYGSTHGVSPTSDRGAIATLVLAATIRASTDRLIEALTPRTPRD